MDTNKHKITYLFYRSLLMNTKSFHGWKTFCLLALLILKTCRPMRPSSLNVQNFLNYTRPWVILKFLAFFFKEFFYFPKSRENLIYGTYL